MESSTDQFESFATLAKAKTFLGREFLTWLWFVAEKSKSPREIKYPRTGKSLQFDLWIDDRMVLEALTRVAALSHQSVMKGGDPSHSQEAAAALAAGKIVKELKIGLNVRNVGEFSAVLSSEDLSPRGLKLPHPQGEMGQADQGILPLSLRIQYMDLFLFIIDQLFTEFLRQRTSEIWQKEVLSDIRLWIRSRQNEEESGKLH